MKINSPLYLLRYNSVSGHLFSKPLLFFYFIACAVSLKAQPYVMLKNFIASYSKNGDYIMLQAFHDISNAKYPSLNEKMYYYSVWDANTGKLLNITSDNNRAYRLADGTEIDDGYSLSMATGKNGDSIRKEGEKIVCYNAKAGITKFVIDPYDIYRHPDLLKGWPDVIKESDILATNDDAFRLIYKLDTILQADNYFLKLDFSSGQKFANDEMVRMFVVTPYDSFLYFEVSPNTAYGKVFKKTGEAQFGRSGNCLFNTLDWTGSAGETFINFRFQLTRTAIPVRIMLLSNKRGVIANTETKGGRYMVEKDKTEAMFNQASNALKQRFSKNEKVLSEFNREVVYDSTELIEEINVEGETNNRTMYVLVKKGEIRSLSANARLRNKYWVQLPSTAIRKINAGNCDVYQVSFSGPVSNFSFQPLLTVKKSKVQMNFATNEMDDSIITARLIFTTRPDLQGYAANKKMIAAWDAEVAGSAEVTANTVRPKSNNGSGKEDAAKATAMDIAACMNKVTDGLNKINEFVGAVEDGNSSSAKGTGGYLSSNAMQYARRMKDAFNDAANSFRQARSMASGIQESNLTPICSAANGIYSAKEKLVAALGTILNEAETLAGYINRVQTTNPTSTYYDVWKQQLDQLRSRYVNYMQENIKSAGQYKIELDNATSDCLAKYIK